MKRTKMICGRTERLVCAAVLGVVMGGWAGPMVGARGDDAPAATKPAVVTLEDVKAQVAKIKAELAAAPTDGDAGERMRGRNEVSSLFTLMQELPDNLDNGQYEQALRETQGSLRQVTSETFRKDLETLSESIEGLQASERNGFGDSAKALLKAIPERLKNAKTEEDVEGISEDLHRMMEKSGRMAMHIEGREDWRATSEQLQQMDNVVKGYGKMIAAEADGDLDEAWQAGTTLERTADFGGTLAIQKLVKQHVEALDKQRQEAAAKELDGITKTILAAKTGADLAGVEAQLQTLVDQVQRRGGFELQQQYSGELQEVQTWGRVLDMETQKKYRTALALLAGIHQQNMGRPQTKIVTDDMTTKKVASLQQALVDHPSEIGDPALKGLADAVLKAGTLEEMDKVAASIDAVASVRSNNDDDADSAAVVQELAGVAAKIHLLGEMNNAMTNGEWGRFWRANMEMTGMQTGVSYEGMMGAMAIRYSETGGVLPRTQWATQVDAVRLAMVRKGVEQSAELSGLKLEIKDNVPLDRAMLDAADAAVAAGDYRRAALVIQAYVAFAYGEFGDAGNAQGREVSGVPAALRADLRGLELYAQANSFEAAGDPLSALIRYREVLQQTGQRVPIAKATERLAAISKSHPELLKEPVYLQEQQPAGGTTQPAGGMGK